MKQHFRALFNSYSEVLFLNGYLVGILLFCITLSNLNVGMAGVISVFSAYLFSKLINLGDEFLNSGFYTYNPLLVGLSIGFLFKINSLSIFFIVMAGIFTFILTIIFHTVFSNFLRLPILSFPFAIVSSFAYLASSRYSNLFVSSLYPHFTQNLEIYLPDWIAGFFKSLGAILFLPNVVTGIVLALILLFSSRILFMLGVLGYYTGTIINGLMVGSYQQVFPEITNFNFILIGMAIGGVFLVPSVKSYFIAMIAVSVSTIFLDSVSIFWSYYGIPAFTLPFNFVSLSFIYCLGVANSSSMARIIRKSPEDTLDYHLTNNLRFKGRETTLFLPFSGKWTVSQGFDGEFTHTGNWKHAFDFVIKDGNEKRYKNSGLILEDHYAFKKPVWSPVRGRVVKTVRYLPDNPIGTVDETNRWGNLIIIQDDRGFFVELSHFAHESINVKEGEWVERRALLGYCGNSGYSPFPHIHVQVQVTGEIGSSTLPFSFVSYLKGKRFHSNDIPDEKEILEAVHTDNDMDARTTFFLDDHLKFDVMRNKIKVGEVTWQVKMAADGTFYFDSGKGRLYFGKHEGTFYFFSVSGNDPHLNNLFLSLPRLPLISVEDIKWKDHVPVGVAVSGIKKASTLFCASFYHDFAEVVSSSVREGKNTVRGRVYSGVLNLEKKTMIELDDSGFKRIIVDDMELRAGS